MCANRACPDCICDAGWLERVFWCRAFTRFLHCWADSLRAFDGRLATLVMWNNAGAIHPE